MSRAFIRTAGTLLLSALLAAPAWAQTLYKLVDRNGKVTYVDKVPKNFDGEVTPIVVDPQPPARVAPRPAERVIDGEASAKEAPVLDTNSARRKLRERLQAKIDSAHAKLAAARKALEQGVEPAEDEFQTIQQKTDASKAKAGDKGPRDNCKQVVDHDGRKIWSCSTIVPGEAYFARQKSLEEAVRLAEEELAAAQSEYRRNVD